MGGDESPKAIFMISSYLFHVFSTYFFKIIKKNLALPAHFLNFPSLRVYRGGGVESSHGIFIIPSYFLHISSIFSTYFLNFPS